MRFVWWAIFWVFWRYFQRKMVRKPYQLGREAEVLAALYYKAQGWKVLERNFASKLGEIDVIAQKGEKLAFIEVKARVTGGRDALEAVTLQKQRRIANSAMAYRRKNRLEACQPELNVFGVYFEAGIWHLENIESAF